MKCEFCSEEREDELIMSTRLVRGKVKHIWICFRCFWLEKFKARENARILCEEGDSE